MPELTGAGRAGWLLICLISLLLPLSATAGGSCVVVKKLGHSLAIEWETGFGESAASATAKAKQRLKQQGYPQEKKQGLHPQASTELPNAYFVIVRTQYTTWVGRKRTSYGCGFSASSYQEAEQLALHDLRNYSWGWKPEFGYEVIEKRRY